MPNPPTDLTFQAWQRSTLFDRAVRPPGATRLTSKVALTLTDVNAATPPATGDAEFTLLAAGDVAALRAGAIKHMAPAPFTRDAETTKLVHVDLWEHDLPWRYTPLREENRPTLSTPDNRVLPPWLVLLVGTGEEIKVDGNLVTQVDDLVLRLHNLAESHRWAHTQNDGHSQIARILSPRGLEPNAESKPAGLSMQHEYVAVLVPAFNEAGLPMWTVNGDSVARAFRQGGVLPALHAWRFWTAEAGDFETLAAALTMPKAGDVGKATVHYRRKVPAAGVDLNLAMEVRGAITSIQEPVPPDADQLAAIMADVDGLNDELDETIGLPHYGRPWTPNPDDFDAGWPHELTDDPRQRGVAGLGVWMGVEGQEALIAAAVQQAGALRQAGQLINHLALGLWTAGRLWDRRLPTDTHARLHILGPMLARMTAADGGIALDRVTSDSSPLPRAIFSSTGQRLLRDGSTQARHLAGGRVDRAAALDAANQPAPLPDRAPDGLPHFDTVAREAGLPSLPELLELDDNWIAEAVAKLWQLVTEATQEYEQIYRDLVAHGDLQEIANMRQALGERLRDDLRNVLQELLAEQALPCEGDDIIRRMGAVAHQADWEYYARVLENDGYRLHLHAALWREIRRCMARRICPDLIANADLPIPDRETFCADLVDTLPPPPRQEQTQVNLPVLAAALTNALDPRNVDAPARRRICARLHGVDCNRLTRPEFAIGIDFPTWELLRQYDKEWLLPGVGALAKDTVIALETNPAFIDAFLVGINSQFLSEMRWRDLAADRMSTPLRMFWGQVNYATGGRQADIEPLAEWAKAPQKPIGDLSHQTIQPDDENNGSGSRLVLLFRSDLFRRYPATLVYLVKPKQPNGLDALLKQTPQLDHAEDGRGGREFFGPIFVGTITPEITFFTFDVTPTDLGQYWLVLDEPPAELRLRNDRAQALDTTNSATLAASALDQPTRVAISGAYLEEQGNQP